MIQGYRGDLGFQQKIWKPVEQKIRHWEKVYADLHGNPFDGPGLGFRDGKTFLMIHQKHYRAETVQHRLNNVSRHIYLFCQKNRSVKRILAAFPDATEDRLLSFLRVMKDKRLMFEDNGKYLSLAVPLRSPC